MEPDEQALNEFLVGRRGRLFRSAHLLCGDRDEAEDLVQTTLVAQAPLTLQQVAALVQLPVWWIPGS